MIHINDGFGKRFTLNWANGAWRDKAGHIWHQDDRTGFLESKEHGKIRPDQYKVVPLEMERKVVNYDNDACRIS